MQINWNALTGDKDEHARIETVISLQVLKLSSHKFHQIIKTKDKGYVFKFLTKKVHICIGSSQELPYARYA